MQFQNRRKAFYFGTLQNMQWLDTPKSGAEVGSEGWSATGTTLSGGGYGSTSVGRHKVFNYSWPDSSSRESEEVLRSYRAGVWGRGLLYSLDPLYYDRNLLPEAWSSPFIGGLGGPLIDDTVRSDVAIGQWITHGSANLPVDGAKYLLRPLVGSTLDPAGKSLSIPIPPGFTLYVSGWQKPWDGSKFVTANAGMWAQGVKMNDQTPEKRVSVLVPETMDSWVQFHGSDTSYIRMFIGKVPGITSQLWATLLAFCVRIAPTPKTVAASGTVIVAKSGPPMLRYPWCIGNGHSGMMFDGEPTLVEHTGVNGGQVGYAASFREVGDWLPAGADSVRPVFRMF